MCVCVCVIIAYFSRIVYTWTEFAYEIRWGGFLFYSFNYFLRLINFPALWSHWKWKSIDWSISLPITSGMHVLQWTDQRTSASVKYISIQQENMRSKEWSLYSRVVTSLCTNLTFFLCPVCVCISLCVCVCTCVCVVCVVCVCACARMCVCVRMCEIHNTMTFQLMILMHNHTNHNYLLHIQYYDE